MRPPRLFPLLALLAALGLTGCGGNTTHGDVEGHVTLDGVPLHEGVIRFAPLDGKSPTASALIAAGAFRERVPVGTHRLEISAPRLPKGVQSSAQIKRGTVDENVALEELVPAQYNVRSTLHREVKAGRNEMRLELKTRH